MDLDLTTLGIGSFAAIAVATTAAIGFAKTVAKNVVDGKEAYLALSLPVAFVAVSKLCGNFADVSWLVAVASALGMGISSQLVHDKLSNPTIKKLIEAALKILKKKAPADVPLSGTKP